MHSNDQVHAAAADDVPPGIRDPPLDCNTLFVRLPDGDRRHSFLLAAIVPRGRRAGQAFSSIPGVR